MTTGEQLSLLDPTPGTLNGASGHGHVEADELEPLPITEGEPSQGSEAYQQENNRRLKILEELAAAKANGHIQARVLEKHQLDWSQVSRWNRHVKEGVVKPNKKDHPFLYRSLVVERMSEARAKITPGDRVRGIETRKARSKAPVEEPEPDPTPVKPRPTKPAKATSRPVSNDDIFSLLQGIGTDRDRFHKTLVQCLKIVEDTLE